MLYDCGDYTKATYNDLISEVTGIDVSTFQRRMWVNIRGTYSYLRPSPRFNWVVETDATGVECYHRVEPEPTPELANIFRYEEGAGGYHQWKFINPPTLRKHVLNRKMSKEINTPYAPFMRYMEAITKVRGGVKPNATEIAEAFGVPPQDTRWLLNMSTAPTVFSSRFKHSHAAELCGLMASDDIQDHYKAYVWVSRDLNEPAASVGRALMMHHHKEVLVVKDVVTSSRSYDQYQWAIPSP
jgi:hypothetical protein